MTPFRYILRSVLHHRFAYAGVFAGAVLGAMVLLGALFAGDSVGRSLRLIGEKRTGHATHLLASGDRFFRAALADDLARASQVRTAPLVYARGTAVHAATNVAASQVQLVGVTDAFWLLAPQPVTVALAPSSASVAINDTLAHRLNAAAGDTLIVRLQKPGLVGGNAPVAGAESTLASLRCTIVAVVGDGAFGRFSLESSQIARPSVFVPIAVLQEHIGQPGRANVLLIDAANTDADLSAEIARAATLADYGLSLTWREVAATFEVTSDRVFIDPEIATALREAVPAAQPVLSYLVNEFRVRDRTTPYSIATATTPAAAPFLPSDLGPGEIVLNDWLAKDLQAAPGDEVRLTYFQADKGSTLVERSATLTVRAVVPLQGLAADRAWMPDFPGISEAESPGDWDPGLPLDLARIRDQDERYWDDHRGAPKAFLSLAGGRALWSMRWGDCTALRIPFDRARETDLASTLLAALAPEMNQLILREFGAAAQSAAAPAVDFGGLFIGMSFFLIVAALALVALLFQFCLLQRNREDALLGAVGLSPRKLLGWRLAEGGLVLLAGCLIGAPLAALYTRGILRFLDSIWAAQSSTPTFVFAAAPQSIAGGIAGFLILSLLAVWLAIRKQTRRALSIRLSAGADEFVSLQRSRTSLVVAIAAATAAVLAVTLSGRALPAQGAFYLAGFALLTAGVALCRWRLSRARARPSNAALTASQLGRLNLSARRSRGLTVVALIATAVFMVLSVASFRKQVGDDWRERASGTGGFTFWVETTAALNPARDGRSEGFEVFEPLAARLDAIVPLRAGIGDNVNCFNLNTSSQPRLLGIDTAALAERKAFSPEVSRTHGSAAGWDALQTTVADGAIPALVDETTLLWALKRKVGDILVYADENGRRFDVQIAGTMRDSIFQGYLVIDEQLLLERFPSHPGYSIFLIDAGRAADVDGLRPRLESAVVDVGGRVDATRDILTAFHQIENTYIAIFNVLGTLGVILGSLGLVIVVARNLRERRGEFAVMTAIGIPRRVLGRMVFAEFGRLVLWGTSIGVIASAIAVWPNLRSLPPAPTLALVGGLVAGIVVLNLVCGRLVFSRVVRQIRPSLDEIVR